MPVKVRVTRGIGDHGGVDVCGGLLHGGDDGLLVLINVEVEKSRNALGHGLGRDDDDALVLDKLRSLLGGHDDVLVVRQHEHRLGRGLVDLPQNIVGGGVHGLTAGDDAVRAEFPEQALHPLARGHDHRAELLFGGSVGGLLQLLLNIVKIIGADDLFAGRVLVGLNDHVLDLGNLKRTVLLTLVQRVARDVRVDVNLENLVVVADNQAVADAVEIGAQRFQIDVGRLLAHNVDRVESKGDILSRVVFGRVVVHDLLNAHLILGRKNLALQRREHRLEDDHVAHAARVHDPGLLKHRVEVESVGQSLVARGDRGLKGLLKTRLVVRGFDRGLGGQARDREDGPLGGLHDGLVGGVDALLQGGGKALCVGLMQPFELAGDPAKQQAQDDAGVSARGPQKSGGHAVGGGGDGGKLALSQLHGGLLHGEPHVRAGVAVRDGEDVQVVDDLHVGLQRGVGTQDALLEGRGVYHISQVINPLFALSDDRVDVDVDTADGYARGFGELVADLIHNAVGDGAHVDAVIHADVQLQRNGAVVVKMHGDALGHGLPAQKLPGAAVLAASDHALDAEAARRRNTGKVSQNLACDADRSLFVGDVDHRGAPSPDFRSCAHSRANRLNIILWKRGKDKVFILVWSLKSGEWSCGVRFADRSYLTPRLNGVSEH